MSGRNFNRLPLAGWQAMSGPWSPAGITAEDLAARSEKCFFWVPGINRWMMVGFIIDASPDNSLACVVGKHATDRTNGVFLEAYITVPSNSNYARSVCPLVVPEGNGYRLVLGVGRTTANTGHVLTCQDLGVTSTWTVRTGPWGTVPYSISSMCWTGSAIVCVSEDDTRVARSTTLGNTWSIVHSPGWSTYKCLTDGMGTVLVFGLTGQLARSTDNGATWANSTINDWTGSFWDAVWFGGNFVVMNAAGDSFISRNGVFWESRSKVIRDPSLSAALPQGLARRSLAAHGQLLFAPWGVSGGASFTHFALLYSNDGFTWHQSGAISTTYAPPTSFGREVHLVSSTPAHKQAPFTPVHQLCWYPGDVNGARGLFSPAEYRGIDGAPAGTGLDEVGLGVE